MFRIKFSESCVPWPRARQLELFFQHPPDVEKLLNVMTKHPTALAITEHNDMSIFTLREIKTMLDFAQVANERGHVFKDSLFINHGAGWQMTVESIHVD